MIFNHRKSLSKKYKLTEQQNNVTLKKRKEGKIYKSKKTKRRHFTKNTYLIIEVTTMKRLFYVIIVSLIILNLTACAIGQPEPTTTNTEISTTEPKQDTSESPTEEIPVLEKYTVSYEKADFPEEIKNAVWAVICYSDEDEYIVSLAADRHANVGLCYATYEILYLRVDDEVCHIEVDPMQEMSVISAVPWGDSVVYSAQSCRTSGGRVGWKVLLSDGITESVVAEGNAASWDMPPIVFELNGTPCFFAVDGDKYGIKTVEGKEIFSHQEKISMTTSVASNGHYFSFLADGTGKEFATFMVGNENGILYEYPLDEKVCSSTITDDYACVAVCSEQTLKGKVIGINLLNGEVEEICEADGPLWQLIGNGDILLGVNELWEPSCVDIVKKESYKLSGYEGTHSVKFYPIGENKFLSQVRLERNHSFYEMVFKRPAAE